MTMEWIDGWLAGLVHRSGQSDPVERSRHERFILSRTVSTVAALAALPPYLVGRAAPTALEALSLVVLLAPLTAVLLISRTGRLDGAQAFVSGALTLFIAGATASLSASSLACLAFAIVPLDALSSGSRRAIGTAFLLGCLGIGLMPAFAAGGLDPGERTALATILAVGLALMFGHVAALAVGDRRLKAQLRAALRSGEAREGAALQSIDDLVTWHDRNSSVLKASSGGAKRLGLAASALQGRGLFGRIHVADRPAYLKAISDAGTATEPVVVQFRLNRGDDTDPILDQSSALARIGGRAPQDFIWVEMRAYRLRHPDEAGSTVVAITRDIGAHQQRIEELEALHRKAQRAGEDRAQLLAAAGHELRTPLNAVIGYAEMLKGRNGPHPMAQDYAEIIHASAQHMLSVASSLIDLAAIEAGGRDLEPEPLDVAELVADCCRMMMLSAERAGVVIAEAVSPGLPELWADRQACQRILLNLLSSAVKFAPRGSSITVQAGRESERIAFTVRDARGGVLAAEGLRPGRGQAEKGSDLSLSVVRGLVGLQQGRISIASVPEDGMKVTVSLPLKARAFSGKVDTTLPSENADNQGIESGFRFHRSENHSSATKDASPSVVPIDPRPVEGSFALQARMMRRA